MKLVSFLRDGGASYGAVVDGGIVDFGGRFAQYSTLRSAVTSGALDVLKREAEKAKPSLQMADVELLPPIPDPDKIICIGLNYKAHAAEAGLKVPEHPQLFTRLTNTLVGHGAAMVRPRMSTDFDYEGELAIVIGTGGRHITEKAALDHVLGYSCFNDGSLRDYQLKHSLTAGKNFLRTGGFGPWISTADEVVDPEALTLTTRLNGAQVQHGRTDDLIFGIRKIVSYLSTWTELAPGDVIATGTPEGVGFARKPQLWLKPGDVVEVDISKVGVLSNRITAEQ
jgi:2-keto-4-pentenoate hydratase/2-oxohepta-3-ene-1,7-dioic acid hydratase in catechol pathway